MKKGEVRTCNGCLAFEHSYWSCPIGSPAAKKLNKPYCGIGYDIEKKGTCFKPIIGKCPKPKTLSNLSKEMKIFLDKFRIKHINPK